MPRFPKPPMARYLGPIIDAHMHLRTAAETRLFVEMAEAYGVRTFLGNGDLSFVADCRREFPGQFHGLVRLQYDRINDDEDFQRYAIGLLNQAVREEDIRGVKFWFKPMFNATSGLFWDDRRLDIVFDFLAEHRLVALVHIADPDVWWRHTYRDTARYGTKAETYRQLVNRLRRHRGVTVQAAHLGGDPEHLNHLDRLLDEHANLYLDLSATKWLARELSRKPDESRQFVVRRADRLLWGSDLVVARQQNMDFDDYATRYYVHRHLWEGRGPLLSPIPDDDADGPVTVQGLDLPPDVLEKIYRLNAERLYRIRADH
ncbi:MAG: amidohydrolase family protein [Planctomycetes bacterium]|nr:amidohydrolase family protein [Planctomycetota bacterium]